MLVRATVYTRNGRYSDVVFPEDPNRFKKARIVRMEKIYDDDFNKLESTPNDFHLFNELVWWWNHSSLNERQTYVAAVNNGYSFQCFKEIDERKIELLKVEYNKKSKKQALRDLGFAMLVRFLEGCDNVPDFLVEHFNAESYGEKMLSSGKVFFSPSYKKYCYVSEQRV